MSNLIICIAVVGDSVLVLAKTFVGASDGAFVFKIVGDDVRVVMGTGAIFGVIEKRLACQFLYKKK